MQRGKLPYIFYFLLAGIWICLQGFDSLPESIAYSAMSHLCTIMDAMRRKLSTICFEKESVTVAGTQFYCLLVGAQRDSPEHFFSGAPLHLATQYRCIGFNPPNLKFLVPAFLLGCGFTHTQKLTSDVYSVVTALPPLKNRPLTVTTGMLSGIINLAAKHKEVLVTSGSLTALYADTADSLHVGSETYLPRNMDDLGTIEVGKSNKNYLLYIAVGYVVGRRVLFTVDKQWHVPMKSFLFSMILPAYPPIWCH